LAWENAEEHLKLKEHINLRRLDPHKYLKKKIRTVDLDSEEIKNVV
jgi:hypothetical protein